MSTVEERKPDAIVDIRDRKADHVTIKHGQHGITLKWMIFLLPIFTVISSGIACITAYTIGLSSGQIKPLPFVPFISDAGDMKPNSSVFTLFLTLSCFFTLFIIIVRYFQIAACQKKRLRANKVSFFFGICFIVGKIVVSSFQLSSSKEIHLLGAFLYFVFAMIYAFCQTYITYKHFTLCCYIVLCRFICCVGLVICLTIFGIFSIVPSLAVHNRYGANVAQGSEWGLAVFKSLFMLSFLYDFRHLNFKCDMEFINSSSLKNNEPNEINLDSTDGGYDRQISNKYQPM